MPEPNEAKRKWTILAQYSGSEGILAVLLRNRGILTEKEKAAREAAAAEGKKEEKK